MPPKAAAEKKPASKAPASKAPAEKKEAGKKTAATGDKKKRTKTRKETYSSYIYKGTISLSHPSRVWVPWSRPHCDTNLNRVQFGPSTQSRVSLYVFH
jgi:histone H2B